MSGSSVSTSRLVPFTLRVSLAILGPPSRRRTAARAGEPPLVARRSAAREATAKEPGGVVVTHERQVALHHGLLVDLPLRVAAADAVHLGLDRLEVAQRP